MFGRSKRSAYDIAKIKQSFERHGLTLIDGHTSIDGSFGIQPGGFLPTLVDVNDFFVRFQCVLPLSRQKVVRDRTEALEFVNELNAKLTLMKITLCHDDSGEESNLHAVAILPGLFDPKKLVDLFGVWQENLSQLIVHETYSTFATS